MRRTSPFTVSSNNKYSGFRGSLWFLNYFCGEEKIKSDIFSAAHCHCHCAALFSYFGAFYSTFLSQLSHTQLRKECCFYHHRFITSFFHFTAFQHIIIQICQHAPHSWKTCVSNGCKKRKQNSSCTKQRSVFVCQFTQA